MGAVIGVAHLNLAYCVKAIVLHHDFRIDGLTVLGLDRIGDGDNTDIDTLAAAPDVEVIYGTSGAEVGSGAGLLRRSVYNTELQLLIEITTYAALVCADVVACP